MKYYEYTNRNKLVDKLCSTPTYEIREELSKYTKAQLTSTYMLIFEAKPLSSFKKDRIADMIVDFVHNMNRWDKLVN